MLSIGIEDLTPSNDITIVGLYYADTKSSQTQVIQQEKLGKELAKAGYIVNNIAINNYAPYSCAQESTCGSTWWYSPWLPWVSDDCLDYIGGCKSDDSRLDFDNWQKPLVDLVSIPVLQDREWEDAWDRFGGGQNDIFIYDKEGKLYKYLCSVDVCGKDSSIGSLSDKKTYDYVKATALEAIQSNGTSRCANYEYPDWDSVYFSDDLFYYYGEWDDDDAWQDRIWRDDDFDDDRTAMSQRYGPFDISERDVVNKRIRSRRKHKKHSMVSMSTFVSVIAVSILILTFGILYYRYKSIRVNKGVVYSAISADDSVDDEDSGNTTSFDPVRSRTKIDRLSFPTYGADVSSIKKPGRAMALV
jgi:hypothetical protein